ncbi:MAG TPA: NAD(+)/NADH kinase [Acidimicrobiia bacterium]
MRVGLVVHHDRSDALSIGRELIQLAIEAVLEIVAGPEDAARLGVQEAVLEREPLAAVVGVGGDGTVLEAARIGLAADAAVLGVNAGRVGFLADVEPAAMKEAIQVLAGGNYAEQRLMTVATTMPDGSTEVGLNDVVMEKMASHRLVSIRLQVDDAEVVTYHADGVVVCTPTGSTAYNLSAGGPIVDRRLEALIVTPVASHSLFAKPLVFSASVEIRCTVVDDRPVGVAVDGRELGSLQPGDQVRIVRGGRPVRFIDVSGRSFDQVLRRKLGLD